MYIVAKGNPTDCKSYSSKRGALVERFFNMSVFLIILIFIM